MGRPASKPSVTTVYIDPTPDVCKVRAKPHPVLTGPAKATSDPGSPVGNFSSVLLSLVQIVVVTSLAKCLEPFVPPLLFLQ